MICKIAICLVSIMAFSLEAVHAQSRQAPPGMFKDLDDEILGEALLVHDKQLFIDDYIIDAMQGVSRHLHQPVKHPQNPIMRRDPAKEFAITYGAVVFDDRDQLFKMWYHVSIDAKDTVTYAAYATSMDGIVWERQVVDPNTGSNVITFDPAEPWIGAPSIVIDDRDPDPARRYKMLYLAKPTLESASLRSCIAYSADGMHWKQEPQNPVVPYSDTQICPFWDSRTNRYVAYLRFGPPNVRIVSRIESEDFLHWSPKLTVINKSRLDQPFNTEFYTMSAIPYGGVYIGLLNTYHGETIKPIPEDQPWMDRVDNQLVFSRNGVTWQRVLADGAVAMAELKKDRDWKKVVEEATFLPYGEFKKDWDWGQIYPFHSPLIVGDEIRFYYSGISGRHWRTYHNDDSDYAVGLATLRLDGFVSVNAGDDEGTLTTRPLVFFGDTLEINANAEGGSLRVEAIDDEGNPIKGFNKTDADPLTSDDVHHILSWKGNADCHLLQGRPIRLRFHLQNAKLYSFTPRITLNHYLQSYD
ncbi:MAG: hypothetical protein O3A29_18855 [Planctomycetota bacterium]|nr:hypothetical protein [Planctomycetota bacterium]